MLNATEHVLRQYSPENFIRLPTSLKGKSELVADFGDGDDDVAIAAASLALADADVCAEDAAVAVAATVAGVVVIGGNPRSFPSFDLAGAALAAVVATMPSPSLGVIA